MPNQDPEIYIVIVLGASLALLLVGFIVTILFLYQRRRHQALQEMSALKLQFEQELLKTQLEIQENTFQTISQELHDNIGQMLSVVKISLAVLPIEKAHDAYAPILNARQVLNKAIIDLSNLTKSLHTDRITEISLDEAIRFELEAVKRSGILTVEFELVGGPCDFEQQQKIFLFRIFQEILNNILKHSQAKEVKVRMVCQGVNNFVLRISDNGIGFNVEEKRKGVSSSSGVGLKSLYNRAHLIGADLEIISTPGAGTTTIISLPGKEI